jgi:hypothetical protein
MKKDELKKAYVEETQKRLKEDEELQKKLFEEAKRRFIEGKCLMGGYGLPPRHAASSQRMDPRSPRNPFFDTIFARYQLIERDMERIARKFAVDYMTSPKFDGSSDFQQIQDVYKFLLIPEDVIRSYL